MYVGLMPVMLNRPALIFHSALKCCSTQQVPPIWRNQGQNGSRLLQFYILPPFLAFPSGSERGIKHALTCVNIRWFIFKGGLFLCLLLRRSMSLLLPGCTVIMFRSDSSQTKDTWGSMLLLYTRPSPGELIFQISSAVKVDNHGWYRCGIFSPW